MTVQHTGDLTGVLRGHAPLAKLRVQSTLNINLTNSRINTGFKHAADGSQCAADGCDFDQLARQAHTQPVRQFPDTVERLRECVLDFRRTTTRVLPDIA